MPMQKENGLFTIYQNAVVSAHPNLLGGLQVHRGSKGTMLTTRSANTAKKAASPATITLKHLAGTIS